MSNGVGVVLDHGVVINRRWAKSGQVPVFPVCPGRLHSLFTVRSMAKSAALIGIRGGAVEGLASRVYRGTVPRLGVTLLPIEDKAEKR